MALELRPNCEFCDCDLPADAQNVMICSYECTLCADCVDYVLGNFCPNCGGDFAPRLIRPMTIHREGTSLATLLASTNRRHAKYSRTEIEEFCNKLRHVPPENW